MVWYKEGKIDGKFEGLTDEEKYQQGWHDAIEKQKPKWSEEDESNMDAIWKALGYVYETKYRCVLGDWLKSLKERCLPQPKQELDEDTQQWVDCIIEEYEDKLKKDKDHQETIKTKINILKSLKDRMR